MQSILLVCNYNIYTLANVSTPTIYIVAPYGIYIMKLVFLFVTISLAFNPYDIAQTINYMSAYTNTSTSCLQSLIKIANNFTSPAANSLLLYSGKGVNDFGNPAECLKNNESHYLFMNTENVMLNITLGLCMPKECNPPDFNAVKKPIASFLSDMLLKLVPPNTTLLGEIHENDIVFLNPHEQQKSLEFFTPMFWVAVLYFVAYMAMSIIGCVYWNSHKFPEDRSKMTHKEKILNAFNLKKNLSYLISPVDRDEKDLRSFNGVRVLAMMWVMLAHVFWFGGKSPNMNPTAVIDLANNPYLSFIYNASYSVDVFFFLSAFLMAYLVLKSIKEKNGKLKLMQIYIHRIIRLYPLLIAAFLLYVYIIPPFGDGPIYPTRYQAMKDKCNNEWYYVLFYAVDFKNAQDSCMGWTWYLGCDMQFFLITPPLLLLFYHSGAAGIILCSLITAGSHVWAAFLANKYDLSYVSLKYNHLFDIYYPRPYIRAPAYFIGIVFGYLYYLHKTNSSKCITKTVNCFLHSRLLCWTFYILGVAGMFFIVEIMYVMNKHYLDVTKTMDICYFVFSRSLFMTFLYLFLFPATIGRGSAINYILGHKIFDVLGKFTYCAYLTHLCFIQFFNNTIIQGNTYHISWMLWAFWSYYAVVMLVSGAMVVVFESPIIVLERAFIFPPRLKEIKEMKEVKLEGEKAKLVTSTSG